MIQNAYFTIRLAVLIGVVLAIALPAAAHPSTVRVVQGNGVGSGVYIGGAVLTAAHVINNGGPVKICTQQAMCKESTRFSRDKIFDIGIVEIDLPNTPPARLASADAAIGSEVTAEGFGSDGILRPFGGIIVGQCGPIQGAVEDWRYFSGFARLGDSGGPVFNRAGEVLGTLHSRDDRMRTTNYTSNGRMRRTMEAYATQFQAPSILPWRRGIEGEIDDLKNRPQEPPAQVGENLQNYVTRAEFENTLKAIEQRYNIQLTDLQESASQAKQEAATAKAEASSLREKVTALGERVGITREGVKEFGAGVIDRVKSDERDIALIEKAKTAALAEIKGQIKERVAGEESSNAGLFWQLFGNIASLAVGGGIAGWLVNSGINRLGEKVSERRNQPSGGGVA